MIERTWQLAKWSLTKPSDCIAAYMVVGPTNLNPRLSSSLESTCDPGVEASMSLNLRGILPGLLGANDQINCDSDPSWSCTLRVALALPIVASILARLRTMPALSINLMMFFSLNRATLTGSNSLNARRNDSRLRKLVSHDNPAWKPSRHNFS